MTSLRIIALALVAVLGFGSAAARAEEPTPAQIKFSPPGVNVQFRVSERGTFDSNPLRVARGAKSLTGSETKLGVALNRNTPSSRLTVDSQIDQGLYNRSKFNSTDFHQKIAASHTIDRWMAALEGRADIDTTRTSETSSYGITIPRVRHTGLSLSPEIAFTPVPGEKISLRGVALDSGYDNAVYTDYRFYTLSPSYQHNLDPDNIALVVLNAQRYQTRSGPKTTIDTIGPSIGWIAVLSPQFTSRLTAGAEWFSQDSPGAKGSSKVNTVFSASLNFKAQRDTASLTASRTQQPFGNGNSALYTYVNLSETRAINEKLSISAGALYGSADYIRATPSSLDSEFGGSAGVAYRVYKQVDVTGDYKYSHQTLTGTSGKVRAHSVMVGLSYRPREMALW